MTGRVDYHLEKYLLTEAGEPERLTRQWAEVMRECHDQKSGAEERLRLALLNVDYVTSFELPFRLLLTRAPQLIDSIRNEFQLSQKNVLFNGKRFGCVYSIKRDLNGIPDEFTYHLKTRIQRIDASGGSEVPYRQIAQQVKAPRERLQLALEQRLAVTALDGLFWFGLQRIAAEVQRLRKTGMRIVTSDTEVFDTLTGTIRRIPVYRLEDAAAT